MDGAEALSKIIASPARKVLIAAAPVDLRSSGENEVVVLLIGDASAPAGGRVGGFGGRAVVRAYGFVQKGGKWLLAFDTGVDHDLSDVELPPGIAMLPITLIDGSETMAYAVIDRDALADVKKSLKIQGL